MRQLDAGQAAKNIDYFFMHQAHATITDWFTNKMGPQYTQFLIDEMFRFLSTSVKVIWYQAPADTPSIPLFTRLNQGRIPLTDAELINIYLFVCLFSLDRARFCWTPTDNQCRKNSYISIT